MSLHPDTFPYLKGILVASIVLVVAFTTGGILTYSNEETPVPTPIVLGTPERANIVRADFKDPFKDVALRGRAAYVFNPQTKEVLFEKNGTTPLPLASLTKLMTALVAKELATGDEIVTITYEDLAQDGISSLVPGERWQIADLIAFTLISSSNDGAYAVASALSAFKTPSSSVEGFVYDMNTKSGELGLPTIRFENPTGLDAFDASHAGAYGSARDAAHLFAYILANHPDILEVTNKQAAVFTSLDNFTHRAENTNADITSIPWLIGSKTGLTDLAGGNLAVAFDAGLGQPIVAVVLGSTQEARFKDIESLAEATFTYFAER